MGFMELAAILVTLTALFSYVNSRFLRLPATTALMALALALSTVLILAGQLAPALRDSAASVLGMFDFNRAVLHGMLGYLLFAGSLHVSLRDLRRHAVVITVLATVGVLVSTAVVGLIAVVTLAWLGIGITLLQALLFGAIVSPTDPVAVLGILKRLDAPNDLETRIAGESLFNDGVGVVVFVFLLDLASGMGGVSAEGLERAGGLLLRQAVGGMAFGLAIAWVAYLMLKSVDDFQVEILISLALVTGGYAAADALHVSGPLAMVVAGLVIGNQGRALAMSDSSREHLDTFWALMDGMLNAVLFLLIGLELLALTLRWSYLAAGALMIPAVLVARYVSVGLPWMVLRRFTPFSSHSVEIMTWAGLRGGLSVAMALSLHGAAGPVSGRPADIIVVMTYVVVAFSILVQGSTVGPLMRRWVSPVAPPAAHIS